MIQINEKIKRKLISKGYEPIGESESRKVIKRFEENKFSPVLFEIFYKNPIYRIIAQQTFEKGIAQIFPITQEIIKLDLSNLVSAPLKAFVCENCGQILSVFNKEKKFEISGMKCPNPDCRNTRFKLEDNWQITIREMIDYLNILKQQKLADRVFSVACPNCFEFSHIDEFSYKDFMQNKVRKSKLNQLLFCNKCKNPNEIIWAYLINEVIREPWKSGAWLEWYVKKILENMGRIHVEQGIVIRDKKTKKTQVEVDGLFVRHKKLFSVECKSLSLDKRIEENEVKDILKLSDFSDRVIFVTTSKVGDNIKERYTKWIERKAGSNLIFVEGKELEDLPKILNSYLK